MTFKFLIDECLSPELVDLAVMAGYVESTCVRNRGWLGMKDSQLMRHVIAGDLTLVTRNAVDFRGGGPGHCGGAHARELIHAGLVCLDSHYELSLNRQCRLFQIALEEATSLGGLINTALEIFESENGDVEVECYAIPGPA